MLNGRKVDHEDVIVELDPGGLVLDSRESLFETVVAVVEDDGDLDTIFFLSTNFE